MTAALPLSPSVVVALSGGPANRRDGRVILLEIALAAVLCAAGVLADRRVRSGRRGDGWAQAKTPGRST